MSAKSDVLDKIKKKSERFRECREESRGKFKPERAIVKFIEYTEKVKSEVKSGVEYSAKVQSAWDTLVFLIKKIDAGALVNVKWYREDEAEDWRDLRVTGVQILWSEKYKKENPLEEGEFNFGVEDMFLAGI